MVLLCDVTAIKAFYLGTLIKLY